MDFGLALPQGSYSDLRRDVARVARVAEEAGFASLWAYERVLFPVNPTQGMYGVAGLAWAKAYEYCADPLTVLTLAGAVTENVRLGTSVLIAPLHNTLTLARTLATLDKAAGGRVALGLGGGWSIDEYRAAGVDFASRGKIFDELIDGLRALLGPNPVTYRDSRIAIEEALVNPKPETEIPILIGGGLSERALKRIALKGDGWMPVNTPGPVMADLWKRQLDMAEAAGRDPRKLRLVAVANSSVTSKPVDSDRQLYQGTPNQIVEDMAAAAAAGAHEIVIALEADVASTDELVDKALMLKDAATAAGLW
jgi:probable F420-dependent oxidoreductase